MTPVSASAAHDTASAASPLSGLRVLVVEDETILSLVLCDITQDLGCTVVGSAARLSTALKLLDTTDFDLAILDINLHGQRVDPVAEGAVARGIPIVFATGYGEDGIPAHLKAWPVVVKPYTESDLKVGMLAALAKAA